MLVGSLANNFSRAIFVLLYIQEQEMTEYTFPEAAKKLNISVAGLRNRVHKYLPNKQVLRSKDSVKNFLTLDEFLSLGAAYIPPKTIAYTDIENKLIEELKKRKMSAKEISEFLGIAPTMVVSILTRLTYSTMLTEEPAPKKRTVYFIISPKDYEFAQNTPNLC